MPVLAGRRLTRRPANYTKLHQLIKETPTRRFTNMLVLSRKESERIRLGDSIVVTVVRVSGDKVRLGIEAPPDVLVLREELEPHKQEEVVEAVS
jgi:carbon storage regulator